MDKTKYRADMWYVDHTGAVVEAHQAFVVEAREHMNIINNDKTFRSIPHHRVLEIFWYEPKESNEA